MRCIIHVYTHNKKLKVTASSPTTLWQVEGRKVDAVTDFIFLGSKITVHSDCSHEIKILAPWKERHEKPRQHIKKQRHHFADKGPYSQSYGFSSSHIQMWELGHKESWALKNWGFWIALLDKTLESPLDCKEIKPVNPKGNQPWIFSLGWLVPKLKLQYFGYLMQRLTHWKRPWCWERLKTKGEGEGGGWDG